MTTHYIDLTLRPDPDFSQAHLLGALYAKLHRALVQLKANDIGVSFPQYRLRPRMLGAILRLHGTEARLAQLMQMEWTKGIRDHIVLSGLQAAPDTASHCIVQRRQFKTSAERLRRRRMQRKGESAEQAASAIPDSVERQPNLPYVHLRSATTKQQFCVFIEVGNLQKLPQTGSFNAYGLSLGATIPWF